MIISTTEELRLYSPSNAIDHFETMAGFIDSSEHDFLEDKLGTPLYDALQDYYNTNVLNDEYAQNSLIEAVLKGQKLNPWLELLSVCQRVVVYDALARAIDVQAISVNGAGVNVAVADDYNKPDAQSIANYKLACIKEAHAALNRLLILLEKWTKEAAVLDDSAAEPSDAPSEDSGQSGSSEQSSIVAHWRTSRYFFLCASLLIPSCEVLQQYVNIYDSREKYIQLLPDLRYIQEDILEPVIGEDLLAFFVDKSVNGTEEKLLCRIIHKMRKYVARELESRTKVIKTDDARRLSAHNEAIPLLTDIQSQIKANQDALLTYCEEAFIASPLYVAPQPAVSQPEDKATVPGDSVAGQSPRFQNNRRGNAFFATPSLL
jgi:hypothetical protein